MSLSVFLIMCIVAILQIYMLVFVIPEEKAIYEQCDFKIMCETGMIDHWRCLDYGITTMPIPNISMTPDTTLH